MDVLLPACLRVLSESCECGGQVAHARWVGVNEKLTAVVRQLEGEKMARHTVWPN
jgi:hypothetical protein